MSRYVALGGDKCNEKAKSRLVVFGKDEVVVAPF